MYNKLNQEHRKEMYNALIHFVNSESANFIIDSFESAIREYDEHKFDSQSDYFEYQYKSWCSVRDKFLTEEKVKSFPVDALLGATLSRFFYGAFVWQQTPQGHHFWNLIIEILGMTHNKMVEQNLAL